MVLNTFWVALIYIDYLLLLLHIYLMGEFTVIQQIEVRSKILDKYPMQALKSNHVAKVK